MRRVALAALAGVAILVAVAVLTPGTPTEPEAGVSTTSTAPRDAAPGLPDPCRLVTETEAEAALGRDMDASREGDSSCSYSGPPDGAVAASVRIDVLHLPGGVDDLLRQRDDALRAVGVGAVVDLPGLGDAAFATTLGDLTLLRVVRGQVGVTVGVAGNLADPVAVAQQLAGLAVGRM